MEFTNEMIKKAQKAASAEELIQIAMAEGISLSAEDAEKYFSFLHESKELNEDELEAVSGGELDAKGNPDPKYSIGQRVYLYDYYGYHEGTIQSYSWVKLQKAYYYVVKFDDIEYTMKFPLEDSMCGAKVIS